MNFLSNFFLSIATFFGFGEPEVVVVPEPAAIIQEMDDSDDGTSETEALVDVVAEEGESLSVSEPVVPSVVPLTEVEEEVVEEVEEEEMMSKNPPSDTLAVNVQTMMVAGGCFWCVESDLEKLTGVVEVVSGYAGGSTDSPTYGTYIKGGHREVVEVTYDAFKVSFEDILIVTMKTTDPTDDDGSFADRGDYYSTAFYYDNDEQKKIIDSLIKEVDEFGPYDKPLAIDVEELPTFWRAEDKHQDYYKGTLTNLKYKYYRNASGRDDLIIKYWGVNDHSPELEWRSEQVTSNTKTYMWTNYQKPGEDELEGSLDRVTFKVTQKEGTERSNSSLLDKNYEDGIYVDILSGEPLYSSKDKFDSGTGWPSFVRPIFGGAVSEHVDKKLFTTRTEIRSVFGDNHLGHVFTDGPRDSTGLRYCMNGVSLKFIPKDQMEAAGYADFLQYI